MNQVLPILSLKKSKEIVLLNVSNFSAEFSATMTQYNVKPVSGSMATQQLNKLIGISKVILYDGHYFTGAKIELTNDILDLRFVGFNDRVGSLQIKP